jgi:ADP-ribose pyrophosphatase YjhB (NUDIX family)
MEPAWLEWARRLNALAQTGLTFAENPYDIERYTAICTIAAEMIAQGAGVDAGQVLDLLDADAGYATPKVDVRGIVFRDGKILLVQERSDGLWTLPGGWADVGNSPADAVVREIREESGFENRATKLLALLDQRSSGLGQIRWLCRGISVWTFVPELHSCSENRLGCQDGSGDASQWFILKAGSPRIIGVRHIERPLLHVKLRPSSWDEVS